LGKIAPAEHVTWYLYFRAELLDHIPKCPFDIGATFSRRQLWAAPFYACDGFLKWVESAGARLLAGDPQACCSAMFRQVQIPERECGWDLRGPELRRTGSIDVRGPLWRDSRIEPELWTIIGPQLSARGCQLRRCTSILDFIFEYSGIGAGVRLVEKLVFGRYCVDRNGDHFDLVKKQPWIGDHRCAAQDVANSPIRRLWRAARHRFQPQPGGV